MCNFKYECKLAVSKRRVTKLSVAILMLGLIACTSREKKVALVIGNYEYDKEVDLENVIDDVYFISKALIKSGFDVNSDPNYEYFNLNNIELETVITKFNEQAENADAAVFYYAGHGMQFEGRNYLLPIDADIIQLNDLDAQAVQLGNVLLVGREDNQKRVNIIILDACRNNRFQNENKGLAEVLPPKETLVAFATSPGRVAWDNGYYAKAFLETIEEFDGIRVQQVFDKISQKVGEQTASDPITQVPMYYTNISGNFYFVKKKHARLIFTY